MIVHGHCSSLTMKKVSNQLIEQKETLANWCPSCKTVLANELVVNNTCERCSLADCGERSAEPIVIQKRDQRRKVEYRLNELLN